jgi:hypothetical protein
MLAIGLDPGGARAFGWAVVSGTYAVPEFVAGGVCTSASTALSHVAAATDTRPAAVGIDSPLFWSSRGDRVVDSRVRRAVCAAGGYGGTVGHVNSLRGACLVEGLIAAKLAQERWPSAVITEAHPKALMAVLPVAKLFSERPTLQGAGNHVRDAALGAFTALALLECAEGWENLASQEPDALLPFGVRVSYWFPRPSLCHIRDRAGVGYSSKI